MTAHKKAQQTQSHNNAEKKQTTVNTSCHSLSRIVFIFIILTIVAGVSWPLIAQPVLRYVNILVDNIPNEELAKEVKMAIQLPLIGLYLAVGLSGISILMLIVGAIYTSTESWHAYNNIDDE